MVFSKKKQDKMPAKADEAINTFNKTISSICQKTMNVVQTKIWQPYIKLDKRNQYVYAILAFITVLVLWNKYFQFVPIFLTCYIFLYGNLSSRRATENANASARTQAIIDALQKQIEKRNDMLNSKDNELISIAKNKVLKSNFGYLQTLKVIKLPKIWDLYGTLRQIIVEEREQYDTTEQIKIFFEINDKESLKNIDLPEFYKNFYKDR